MNLQGFSERFKSIKRNRYTVVFIIYVAFFLDNMLLTVVVPIIPDYLHATSLKTLSKSAFYDNVKNLWTQTPVADLKDIPMNSKVDNAFQSYFTASTSISTTEISIRPHAYRYKTASVNESTMLFMERNTENGIKKIYISKIFKRDKHNESTIENNKEYENNIEMRELREKKIENGPKVNQTLILDELQIVNVASAPRTIAQDNDDFEEIERENGPVGVLLSSKALIQLVLNPLVGVWTSRVGYKVPIFFGSANLLIASLLFAYSESYSALVFARVVHGVCSSCVCVSGMCLAADSFRRHEGERSRAMAALLGGGALGVLAGYPLGGLLYEFVGKKAPFLAIAVMALISLVMQLIFLDFDQSTENIEPETETVWWPLITDSVIVTATGAIFISTSAMAVLEPCLPIWLMTHLKPEKWQMGTVFIPDSIGYLLGTNLLGAVACKVGQWNVSVIALLVTGITAIMIPSAESITQLLLPHFGLGLGIGALDAAVVPLLATLVDTRHGHTACYGAVFSLQQTAVSLAYSLAPLVGGATARTVGFAWTLRGLGFLNVLYGSVIAYLAWKLTSTIQSTRLLDSHSSDCVNLNRAISMATYGSTYDDDR